ncbi:hypothetical protein QQ020_26010 [Fulvivirgaceae bacterium BMA12]|uniref:Holin n=1 Tax=Agaribacillus aureus TaxID=3051825 RepID=A0ABT8LCQ0_9BACT|nr:hypothetical protein [Fulvivirgaceae bacterium BMA12]
MKSVKNIFNGLSLDNALKMAMNAYVYSATYFCYKHNVEIADFPLWKIALPMAILNSVVDLYSYYKTDKSSKDKPKPGIK